MSAPKQVYVFEAWQNPRRVADQVAAAMVAKAQGRS